MAQNARLYFMRETSGWSRRRFLRAGGVATAASTLLPTTLTAEPTPIFVPKVNDAINIHPLRLFGRDPNPATPLIVPGLIAKQLELVYELGFDGARFTVPFSIRGDFFAGLAYARLARALGIDAVVVVSDFAGFALAGALADPRKRLLVLRLYQELFRPVITPVGPRRTPGRIAFQILNEPAHFLGIPPDFYVREILGPCFQYLRANDPDGLTVGAAEVGNDDGPERMRAMLDAGLEESCDRVAYHVYDRDVIPRIRNHVRGLTWVTESGIPDPTRHLPWVREVFPEIRTALPEISRVFYYDLYDPDPRRFRVVDIVARGASFDAIVESPELIAHWRGRIAAAAPGASLIAFRDIVPDMAPYLPTAADVRIYDETLRLLR
jgi:hypothetical protein